MPRPARSTGPKIPNAGRMGRCLYGRTPPPDRRGDPDRGRPTGGQIVPTDLNLDGFATSMTEAIAMPATAAVAYRLTSSMLSGCLISVRIVRDDLDAVVSPQRRPPPRRRPAHDPTGSTHEARRTKDSNFQSPDPESPDNNRQGDSVRSRTRAWSGRRTSRPGDSVWEADTLPAELLPLGGLGFRPRARIGAITSANAARELRCPRASTWTRGEARSSRKGTSGPPGGDAPGRAGAAPLSRICHPRPSTGRR